MARALLALAVAASGIGADAARPAADGHWRSVAPEPLGGGAGAPRFLVREFWLRQGAWRIRFTLFQDRTMSQPLLSGEAHGRFAVLGKDQGPGNMAEFAFDDRTMEPANQQIADALTSAQCGTSNWKVGQAQSVYERGCLAFRVLPRSACGREYDRLALSDGLLRLGLRPADGNLCTAKRRPQMLGPPMRRVPDR